MHLPRLGVVVVLLVLPRDGAAQGTTTAAAGPRVVVQDSIGRPIPFVSIQAGGSRPHVASDSGIAVLTVPRGDSLKLLTRRIGFEPFEGWVRPDSAGDFRVNMRPLPQNIAKLTIYERNTPLSRTGFYDRMERVRLGAYSATFWTPEAIEQRNPHRTSVLLEGQPGVRIRTMGTNRRAVALGRGGTCPMTLVVDGHRMSGTVEEIATREGQREIDTMVRRDRISAVEAEHRFLMARQSIDDIVAGVSVAAMEIYSSLAAAPAELQRHATSESCGLVVVWTGRR
jgi:hypothetical protein